MGRVDWAFVKRYLGQVALAAFLLLTFMFVAGAPAGARRAPVQLLWDSVIRAVPIALVVTVVAAVVLVWISRRSSGH